MAGRYPNLDLLPLAEGPSFSDTGYASTSAATTHSPAIVPHPPPAPPPFPGSFPGSHTRPSSSTPVTRPLRTSPLSVNTSNISSTNFTSIATLHTATLVAVSRPSRSQTLSQNSSRGIYSSLDSPSTYSPTRQSSFGGFASGPVIKGNPLLSNTASPPATRSSSVDCLVADSKHQQRPEQRFSRAYSVDSPTIYDFDIVRPYSPPAAVPATSISNPYYPPSDIAHGQKQEEYSPRTNRPADIRCASPSPSIQSTSSLYLQSQGGDTDFEDLHELQTPINTAAGAGPRAHDFETRNIPAGNPGTLQTEVPGYLPHFEEFTTPIDASPTDDPPLGLILAEEERDTYKSSHPSPSINSSMLLSPTPQHQVPSNPNYTTTSSGHNSTAQNNHVNTRERELSLLQASTYIIPPTTAATTTATTTNITTPAVATASASASASITDSHIEPLLVYSPGLLVIDVNKPLPEDPPREPKSPGSSKLATFFGWTSPSGSPSVTEFSDRGYSPLPSPLSPRPTIFTDDSPVSPRAPEPTTTTKTSEPTSSPAAGNSLNYCEDYLQTPTRATTTSPSAQIDEMEDELKAISAELAASIRREMDLEDLADRLQTEVNNPQGPGKRTSDYFSDSGVSTAKFSDYDQSREEIEKIQRRSEQEKAQLRLELTNKLQDEREKRMQLDQQIQDLAAKASQADIVQMNSADANGRLKGLESTCDDLRRRLAEEQKVKDNFEGLLSVLKGELQNASNERDNLRDEIVPQLRAQVEGLEAQADNSEKLAYETTKMQQEMSSLKEENISLKKVGSRDELTSLPSANAGTGRLGKLRSNSVAAAPPSPLTLTLPPAASLSRSISIKSPNNESRKALSERLKDVEAQRDALHNALKNLLERQEFQNRENEKKIKSLELDRDRLLSSSPRKANYEKEVASLRAEINVLRRRAEEAIEHRWHVEKGLGGLKMDLDRAKEDIISLRALLKEKDILIPEALSRSSSFSDDQPSDPISSASLDKSYHDLKTRYSEALERIKKLEVDTQSGNGMDDKTKLALQNLQQTLANAVSDRDMARSEVEGLQGQIDLLHSEGQGHLSSESDLAMQLTVSASRVEDLASQVSIQLSANTDLRRRLSECVGRGEAAQKSDTARITQMQARLRQLEDQLVSAQTAAEERVARHEEEVALIREGLAKQDLHRSANLRVASPLAPPRSPAFMHRSPRSPMFSPRSPRMALTPRRNSSRSIEGSSENEDDEDSAAQVEILKVRVGELERALADTETDMQEIVGRMSEAQIEVLNLQEERETALRATRKLQKQLEEEQVKSFEQRFRNMTVAAQTAA